MGMNDRAVVFVDDAVDSFLAVRAQDLVLAQPQPLVAIDLAALKRGDGFDLLTAPLLQRASSNPDHLRREPTSSRTRYFRNRPTSDAGPLTFSRTRFPSYLRSCITMPASMACQRRAIALRYAHLRLDQRVGIEHLVDRFEQRIHALAGLRGNQHLGMTMLLALCQVPRAHAHREDRSCSGLRCAACSVLPSSSSTFSTCAFCSSP